MKDSPWDDSILHMNHAQATATGEVVNYIKFCEAIDRVQPKPWLLLIVDDVDVGSSRRDVLSCFFWKPV